MGVLAAPLQAIGRAINFLGERIDSLGSWIGQGFNALGNAFETGINALGGLLTTIRDSMGSVLTKMHDIWVIVLLIPAKILELPAMIGEMLKTLFIPSDDYFALKFEGLKDGLETKLSVDTYAEIIESFANANGGHFEDINAVVMGRTVTIVNAEPINSALSHIHRWVRGVIFALLAFYNFNQVLKLIRGTDYIGSSGSPSGQGTQLSLGGADK